MEKFLKALMLAIVALNYVLCPINLVLGNYTQAINQFTIGTLMLLVYRYQNQKQ
jgi:hypothetical protein